MPRLTLKTFATPLLLLWIVVLSYGVMIPWLGFYGDDWSYIGYHQILGFRGPGLFAAYDRPFSSTFYNLVIAGLGDKPWPYHILLVILRWLCALAFLWILRILWPGKDAVTWAAVLFALYPGFSQTPIAVEFILHFSGLLLTLSSIALMLKALQHPRSFWILTIPAILATTNIFAIEYFIGLELLRPILLWLVLGRSVKGTGQRLGKTLLYWSPYLIVFATFIIWRVFCFQFPTYGPNVIKEIIQQPASGMADLIKRIIWDLKTVTYNAWRQVLRFPSGTGSRLVYALVVPIGFITLLLQFITVRHRDETNENQKKELSNWAFQPLLLGGFALLIAGIPFWITGIKVEMDFPWDRTTLPFMPGASLVLTGLVELIIRKPYRVWLFTVLASLGIGFHITNAEIYKVEWENVRNFFWQVSWRAPGLQVGTVLASDEIRLYRVADSALTMPLILTFAPNHAGERLPYKLFDLTVRMGTEYAGIPGLEEGLVITHNYRSTQFSSTTSSILVFYQPNGACVHILAPADAVLPGLPEKVQALLPLSRLELIFTSKEDAAQPPELFGHEPAHDWCYYYEKADLARQMENWQGIVELAGAASINSAAPNDFSEWIPFIQGFAMTGDLDEAKRLSVEAVNQTSLQPAICETWSKISINSHLQGEDLQKINEIRLALECIP